MPGPVGKRSDQRHGHRTKAENAVDTAPGSAQVAWPDPDPTWHEIAAEFFSALGESGQRAFYEPSDVALAKYLAEAMSTNLRARKFSAVLFGAVWSSSGDLLATEGARRRLRVELDKGPAEEDPEYLAAVASIADRRRPTGA